MISGSLRTPDRDAWDLAPAALREVLDQVLAHRRLVGPPPYEASPVVNAESAARQLAKAGRSFLGHDAVIETEHSWAATPSAG